MSERTEVALLYDEDALYIAFWGYDLEPDRIIASRMERDFSWGSDDCFEVIIDTYADHRTGYLFVTNPNGARADALVTDNGRRSNGDWDGVWNVRARTTAEGWFAEFRIPFATLKFPDAPEQTWGINFERNIRRKREQALWQGWSRNYNLEQVSHAGTLEGIAGVSSGHLIDVRPHLIGGIDNTRGEPQDRVAVLGVWASYLLTPTFKLNVTINPDFAQVESDRLQVNLSRFSITYPELREFFLEGQEFFDFSLGDDIRPFYSRRHRWDRGPPGGELSERQGRVRRLVGTGHGRVRPRRRFPAPPGVPEVLHRAAGRDLQRSPGFRRGRSIVGGLL